MFFLCFFLFVCFNSISPTHLFHVRCALTNPTACMWSQKKVLCLDQIYWRAILLGKHGFLMTQIKRLLPNELLARPLQRKETLQQARTEGKLSLGKRKEADGKKKKVK